MRFTTESIGNMLTAFIWPLWVIGLYPPWGIIALVLMFAVFDRLMKQRVADWFFDEDTASTAQEAPADLVQRTEDK